jgi:hypothetical protein
MVRDMFEHDSGGWRFDEDAKPDPASPCSSTSTSASASTPPSDAAAWEEPSAGVSQSQCPPSQPEELQRSERTAVAPPPPPPPPSPSPPHNNNSMDDASNARVRQGQCASSSNAYPAAPHPAKRVLLMKALNVRGEKEWSGKGGLDKEASDFMEDDVINNNQ